MSTLFDDIRHGIRLLAKKPGFTLTAVSTLALGIGANIAIFSFVNAYLLRPFPYADAERLVDFTETHATFARMSIAYANFQDWQTANQTFETMACYREGSYTLTGSQAPERIRAMQASANFLPMLGVHPEIGRLFEPADDQAQAEATVIVSRDFWQRRLSGRPNLLGESIVLDGQAYRVIGVLPAAFNFPPIEGHPIDVWMPIGLMAKHEWFMSRSRHSGIKGIGKLKVGVTLSQARTDLKRVAAQLEAAHPDTNAGCSLVCTDFHEQIIGDIKPTLVILMCAVLFVLLIVCVNIANLLLVRSADRLQELSIRTALGAGRFRVLRQLLSENMMLVVLGGGLGFFVAHFGYHLLSTQLPDFVRHNTQALFRIDGRLAAFALAVTLGSSLIFGLFPAWRLSRVAIGAAMRQGGRTTTDGLGHSRLRGALVVSEIALALILLAGTGLMLRSFIQVMQADPGYNPDSALTLQISLPDSRYPDQAKKQAFCQQLLDTVRAMPSVKQAGVTSNMLGGWQSTFYVEGTPIPEPGQDPYAEYTSVSSTYFEAMGVPLLQGRVFTEQDVRESQPVVVVDERFAQKWWPGQTAIGKRLQLDHTRPDPSRPWAEVVGVVRHVKHYGVDRDSRESLYLSANQTALSGMTLVVRSQVDPMQLVSPVRKAVWQLDPDLPISGVQTLQAIVDQQSFMRRLTTRVLGCFALTALLLSVLGLYGVCAYLVSQRTNEIGVRMALGACRGDILQLVLAQGVKLIVVGTGIGLFGALLVTRMMTGFLFQVTAWDPLTFLGVTVVLAGATLLACWVPAMRATRVNPMEALRYE